MEAIDSRDCATDARSLLEGKGAGRNDDLALQVLGDGDAKRREGRRGGYQSGG